MVTVYNSKLDNSIKKKMLEYLRVYDKNPNYDVLIAKLEEEDSADDNIGSPYKKSKIED